ncbi:unnamed protein product [Soboliphyme baturini]|uniref:Uncharacterized protein n=1 Tax=Soboliphyme baturini TaxID=241478 RepID=A0A183J4H4_9BILA|nr:unnamed protein product [Soboliphyme baturini]
MGSKDSWSKDDREENNNNTLDEFDDEEVAQALDLHRLIVTTPIDEPPPQTAEQVIEEIDEIMQVTVCGESVCCVV